MSYLLPSNLLSKCRYGASAFLLGVVLLAGSVTPGYSVTVACIPESCPCDPEIMAKKSECVRVKTGNCCKEPDCEFFEAIVKARAWRNAHQKIKEQYLGTEEPDENVMKYRQHLREELNKEHAKYAKCPKNYLNRTPFLSSSLGNDCAIRDLASGRIGVTLEDLQQNSNACSEVVAAEWAKAQKAAEFCDELVDADPYEDMRTYLEQQIAETEAKVDSLEDSLVTYYSRCTDVLGAEMEREVADKGLDALIDKAMPKPPPKKAKPNKSGKKKTKPAKGR
jgi:hypothetical protein